MLIELLYIYVSFVLMATGQESNLCTNVYDFCNYQQRTSESQANPPYVGPAGRPGKSGPRGAPGNKGDSAVVDYDVINANILENIKVAEARLDQKLERLALMTPNDRTYPQSCRQVHKLNSHSWMESGGLFNIYPTPISDSLEVYCDLVTDSGGWIVFQRRMDGSVDFYKGWNDYVNGFGEINGEFWLGLESIHQLSKGGNYELRVDMEDWEGNKRYAKYGTAIVGDSSTNYKLTVGEYSGDAGDALGHSQHQNRGFSTKDADHDTSGSNCAVTYHGAFWYGGCHATNPNGRYIKGGDTDQHAVSVVWALWKGHNYSLKFIEMKIRPRE